MVVIRLAAPLGDKDADLVTHSDNCGMIGAFERARSRYFQVYLSIRRTTLTCLSHSNLIIHVQYVNTLNNLADPVSRSILGSDGERLPIPVSLPKELLVCLSNA